MFIYIQTIKTILMNLMLALLVVLVLGVLFPARPSAQILAGAASMWQQSGAAQNIPADATTATLLGKGDHFQQFTYRERNTARDFLGRDVTDQKGEKVATVHDVLLDGDDAHALILNDGGFLGIGGKMVALEYGAVVQSSPLGDVIRPVPATLVDNVMAFDYQSGITGDSIRVMGDDDVSLRDMMGAVVLGIDDRPLGQIDNATLKDGRIGALIVTADPAFGLGAEKFAFAYDDTAPVLMIDGKIGFRLSDEQIAAFDQYRAAIRSN